MNAKAYTADNIAKALGRTPRAIRLALADVPAQLQTIRGQKVRAWLLETLPAAMLAEFDALALKRNFNSREQLLSAPPKPWQPPVSFHTLPPVVQHEAEQWRDALCPVLSRRAALPEREWKALAREQCQRTFGRDVPDNTWLAHLDLAVNRDGGLEQWANLSLYVAESAYQTAPASPAASVELRGLHGALNEIVAQLENKAAPTLDDRKFLLNAACEHFAGLCATHPEARQQREIERSLLAFLRGAVPALPLSGNTWRRKLKEWRRNGAVAGDGRQLNSGRKGATLCADCQAKVTGSAVQLDGNIAQAWRRLHQAGQLCPACSAAWTFNARRYKSYVPASVRQAILADVKTALPHRHGPKFTRLAGPYIPRDWSDTGPGDWSNADDVTWNHVYKYRDDDGQWQFGRGECLLMTDLRTGYPLGFELIAGKYNSLHIRTLMLHVHDLEAALDGDRVNVGGLPHLGVYFENSVWAARLIEGPRRRGWQANPWRDTELGLREHGLNLEVRHATAQNPRSKPIEGLIRILQERMRCEPGFVGFDERRDEREVIQDYLARARRNHEDPENSLLTMEQWGNRVAQILQEYADDPQNGKMLPGVSPAEAWLNGIGGKPGVADKPLRHLPNEARFLLASHKRPVDVTSQGIRFHVGRREFVYWGEAIAPFVNRRVLAFFNLECPELLVCSNLERTEYFTVKAVSAPAMTADRGKLRDLKRERAAFTRPAKVLFGGLPKPLGATITRDTEHDEATRELGAFVNQATANHRDAQAATQREVRKVRQLAGALGSVIPEQPRNVRRVKEGLDLEAEALAEIRAMQDKP